MLSTILKEIHKVSTISRIKVEGAKSFVRGSGKSSAQLITLVLDAYDDKPFMHTIASGLKAKGFVILSGGKAQLPSVKVAKDGRAMLLVRTAPDLIQVSLCNAPDQKDKTFTEEEIAEAHSTLTKLRS
ncbi:MAG: hypothetical protein V1722_00135 [Candidatus Micrarchaeota archaeon]